MPFVKLRHADADVEVSAQILSAYANYKTPELVDDVAVGKPGPLHADILSWKLLLLT